MTKEVRPRRADAIRNKERIIETALDQFSLHGINAPLDSIAKQAGVGPGTLYRHFPTRDRIIAAALGACHLHFQDVRTSLLESEDSLSALQDWLTILRNYVRRFEGLAVLLLNSVNDPHSALSSHCNELQNLTEEFLSRAQQSGLARQSVSARSLFVAQLALSCVEGFTLESASDADTLEALLREGYASSGQSS